jgi:MoaA/NifB/PqqE/SkfB family radical SAM enzyme
MKFIIREKIGTLLSDYIVDYLEKDPFKRSKSLFDLASFLDIRGKHSEMIDIARKGINESDGIWSKYYYSFFTDLDRKVLKKFVSTLVLKSILTNAEKIRNREKLGCHVPWGVIIDPTSACNLRCTGCWAADYGKNSSLDFETIDRIICEFKELGTYVFIFSGGEPLLRKDDIIRLCEKHDDCYFTCFTNGTLIDNDLAGEIRRVGNFAPALSIEGFENETDFRRGRGTFRKVIEAMEILKDNGVMFGCSTCYHRHNTEVMGSEEFVDYMITKGCRFAWYFTYMPVGSGAVPDLIATPEQRKFMYHRIRELRKEKPLFLMDFWNDGEFIGGCIAAGRRFLHINANGDAEPCAFIHYSNINIHNASAKELLCQPLFMEYKKRQPFNSNLLQPCPLLDNPHHLREIVHAANARPTHLGEKETVEELTSKCEEASKAWAPVAHKLWMEKTRGITEKTKAF